MDKTAFFTMPSGLYVVSAAADGLRAGCVINTAVQVTSMPPRISVAVNKDNVTSGVIASAKAFALTCSTSVTLGSAPAAIMTSLQNTRPARRLWACPMCPSTRRPCLAAV